MLITPSAAEIFVRIRRTARRFREGTCFAMDLEEPSMPLEYPQKSGSAGRDVAGVCIGVDFVRDELLEGIQLRGSTIPSAASAVTR